MSYNDLTFEMIQNATQRINPHIIHTPLLKEYALSEELECDAFCKPEMLQRTGSFKIRGALNKILSLSPEQQKHGIICSSSGNHGKACAYICQKYHIPAVIVLPEDTPSEKTDAIRSYGAEVILGPRLYDDRWKMVKKEQKKHGYTIVHAYEDYEVMAGQGTIGLEIINDLPDSKPLDTIVVPVGGGGLISGISTAVRTLSPSTKIIGVQAKASPGYAVSFKAKKPIETECFPTLADGITCRKPGIHPFPVILDKVDEIVTVEENDITDAVRLIAKSTKLIAEPTSSVVVAAVLGGQIKVQKDERICFVLTSGNWNIELLGKLYNKENVPAFL